MAVYANSETVEFTLIELQVLADCLKQGLSMGAFDSVVMDNTDRFMALGMAGEKVIRARRKLEKKNK